MALAKKGIFTGHPGEWVEVINIPNLAIEVHTTHAVVVLDCMSLESRQMINSNQNPINLNYLQLKDPKITNSS